MVLYTAHKNYPLKLIECVKSPIKITLMKYFSKSKTKKPHLKLGIFAILLGIFTSFVAKVVEKALGLVKNVLVKYSYKKYQITTCFLLA